MGTRQTLLAGLAGGLSLNLALILTFRVVGFGWNGDSILLDPALQSPKLIDVWTDSEPLPKVYADPLPILLGLMGFGLIHLENRVHRLSCVFETAPLPETRDSDELIDSEFGQVMETNLRGCVGEYEYVSSGCKQLLRQLARVRSRNYFEEDLDAVEEFVTERIDELNQRREGEERFPVHGLGGEPNYRRVDNRDLLLDHD